MNGKRLGHRQGLMCVVAAEVDGFCHIGLGFRPVLSGLERLPRREFVDPGFDEITDSMDDLGAFFSATSRPRREGCPRRVQSSDRLLGRRQRSGSDDPVGLRGIDAVDGALGIDSLAPDQQGRVDTKASGYQGQRPLVASLRLGLGEVRIGDGTIRLQHNASVCGFVTGYIRQHPSSASRSEPIWAG